MNAQETLNYVAKHLFDQGIASVAYDEIKDAEICMYRTSSGLSCAVGCLISDDQYDHYMECRNVYSLVVDYSDKPGKIPESIRQNQQLLKKMQEIHDTHMPRFRLADAVDDNDREIYHAGMLAVSTQIKEVASTAGLEYPQDQIPFRYWA